jgi:hypothetical protein
MTSRIVSQILLDRSGGRLVFRGVADAMFQASRRFIVDRLNALIWKMRVLMNTNFIRSNVFRRAPNFGSLRFDLT